MKFRFLPLMLLLTAGSMAAQQSPFGDLAVCTTCHSRLTLPQAAVDLAGARMHPRLRAGAQPDAPLIGPASLWPASMMAHSARDPYWQAKVRFETGQHPALAAVIEDTCLRCHAPMQQYDYRATGARMAFDAMNDIGKQGVGCTVCHQIMPDGLGTRETFEAEFHINDQRQIYGPHAAPFGQPMINSSGYQPVQASHVLESAMCGSCHTVITPTVDAGGSVVGEFVEQSPFLEWLVSDFAAGGQTCQSCHMPVLKDAANQRASQYIAHNPGGNFYPRTDPRQPFGQHFLVGGNAPMLRLMAQAFPAEAELLSANLERTRESLANALSIEADGELDDGRLAVEVTVRNHTGHKLPTGFPSRRVWLHVRVTGSDGRTVFESGAWDPQTGEVVGAGGLQPHHAKITRPDQVMIYEAEMADTDGNQTVTLLRGARYAKDNRLLPRGFSLTRPLPAGIEKESIAPAGVGDDAGFQPGAHQLTYEIAVPEGGPFLVQVEALYQSVKPAHVGAMDRGHSLEEQRFIDLFAGHSAPATMARTEIVVGES